MQPLEIDSAVFCDGARYTIISRENSSILTCPVASGAGGYTLNRVEGRDIDLELDRLTGHATLSPNTADPCLVARLAAEASERSRSLADPETQARGAKRAAGSTAQGEAVGRGPAL